MNNDELNGIGAEILDSCIAVHKELGPGLLESAYTIALKKELEDREYEVMTQVPIEASYKGINLGKVFVMDMIVDDGVILEIKSVDQLHPIHKAQLITYLKLSKRKLGYLINFNVSLMKDGFHRIVYKF
ncbi:MAG: GxxExxY protein [Chitinophagaceae bacterium]|nr:GxxExxY protein [Chitinophagaceae bacterium]MBN8666535.1 GxxExxY protein [Chitinophagales bacterium]MDX1955915.1 GxxExxY protein [Chitinophagaceae bacterium]